MLEVVQLSHRPSRPGQVAVGSSSLEGVDFILSDGQMAAVVGAEEVGALLKRIAGVERADAGNVFWRRAPLQREKVVLVGPDQLAVHVGLGVKEHIVAAALLRVEGMDETGAIKLADQLLLLCGLDAARKMRAEQLSALDRRRLAVAVALVSRPEVLLVQDLVSDLPATAHKAFVSLLDVVRKDMPGRVVLHGCHHLEVLEEYDSVVLLHEGRVVFHGPARALTHYFTIESQSGLLEKLSSRPADRWQDSWNRHRDAYYAKCEVIRPEKGALSLSGAAKEEAQSVEVSAVTRPGGAGQQGTVVMKRLLTQLRRCYGKRMVIVVPCVVLLAVLALLSQGKPGGGLSAWFLFQAGLIFFGIVPVVTAAVALSREASRAEWDQGGSRVVWLLVQVVVAGGWAVLVSAAVVMGAESFMGILPGNGGVRGGLLTLGGMAFALLCAGTAAWSGSLAQAQARCWALAFVNVLFSGALVAWPRGLGTLVQPLFTLNQVWGGCLETLKGTEVFGAIEAMNPTWFPTPSGAMVVLLVHALVGASLLVMAVRRVRRVR